MAADLRARMNQDPELDPMDLFDHVYRRANAAAARAA